MMALALPFPAIDPVLVEIGPFAVRWYALAYIIGILLGWLYARHVTARDALWSSAPRPQPQALDDFVLWATIGIVAGGRLGYVLFYNLPYFVAHPAEILALWQGGMAFHGGLIGMIVAMVLFARRRAINVWSLFDLVAAAAPIGLFFGRIANFINGELWGRTSDVAWAMVFPGAGPLPRHPSQLYEAALEGLLLFLVLRLLTHHTGALRRPGLVAGVFTAGYGIARILGEQFRMPDAHIGFIGGSLTMGTILSLPMVLIGALVIWSAAKGYTARAVAPSA